MALGDHKLQPIGKNKLGLTQDWSIVLCPSNDPRNEQVRLVKLRILLRKNLLHDHADESRHRWLYSVDRVCSVRVCDDVVRTQRSLSDGISISINIRPTRKKLMRQWESPRRTFFVYGLMRRTLCIGGRLLCQSLLLCGLLAPVLGQETISSDTTQTGGTHTTRNV